MNIYEYRDIVMNIENMRYREYEYRDIDMNFLFPAAVCVRGVHLLLCPKTWRFFNFIQFHGCGVSSHSQPSKD